MHRLGGEVIGFAEPGVSGAAKGENLADTIRMVGFYSDIIVLRHRIEGAAKFAAEIAEVPVINAGDGSQHHPSQSLTDLYTIRDEFGTIDNRKVMIVGDLRHTRSASSLAYGISRYDNVSLFLVSPTSLRMRPEITDYLSLKGLHYEESENPRDFLEEAEVVYVTRLQRERFEDPAEAERFKLSYVLTKDLLKYARPNAIIMHHLPRIDEIPLEIDYSPHARYFEQAANGLPVRMALLYLYLHEAKSQQPGKPEHPSSKSVPGRCRNLNCISNQPREPIVGRLREVTRRKGETVVQCEYCGRYSKGV